MTNQLSPELWYTALSALLTSLIWMPYAMNRMLKVGLWTALQNPQPDPNPTANWAYRMKNAHHNSVENLIVFATLAIIIHITGLSNAMTETAAGVFFVSRLAHLLIYTIGVPVLRTLAFFTGFLCEIVLALRIIGYL